MCRLSRSYILWASSERFGNRDEQIGKYEFFQININLHPGGMSEWNYLDKSPDANRDRASLSTPTRPSAEQKPEWKSVRREKTSQSPVIKISCYLIIAVNYAVFVFVVHERPTSNSRSPGLDISRRINHKRQTFAHIPPPTLRDVLAFAILCH